MRCTTIVRLALIAFVLANAPFGAGEPIVSHIPRERVKSSGLAAIGYSRHLHALEVEFVNGAVYRYLDVPPQIYRELMQANSKARFYDEHVRGHFQSVRVARSASR